MILKKKVILVDDVYDLFSDFVEAVCETVGFCELIKTDESKTSSDALNLIRKHPEADFILLDGSFESGDCLDVLPHLSKEELGKIICYSGSPEEWREQLAIFGIHHFSAKNADFPACILGTCSCVKKPSL